MPQWLKKTLIICLWLAVWQVAAMAVGNDILLATPVQTVDVLLKTLFEARFWASIGFSMLRIGLGFAIAFLASLLLGALAFYRPLIGELLGPAVTFVKSVPVVCFIVMILIWFGSQWVALTAVALVAFPPFYFAVLEGLSVEDRLLGEMLDVFKVTGSSKVKAYHWPAVLPFIEAAAKTVVGMSWKSGVAAELIGLPFGSIGERIYSAKILLDSADVFSWTFVVVALSVVTEAFFLKLLGRSAGWAWSSSLPRPRSSRLAAPAPNTVTGSGLTKAFEDKPVLSGLDIRLEPGYRYLLNSPSGSGKTTLLRLLAGLDKPDSGSLASGNSVAMVFQEARLFEGYSAVENLRLACGPDVSVTEIKLALGRLLPADSLDQPVEALSGGMRRRVELCRALLKPSQLLLLDEPFAGLDADNSAQAKQLLLELLGERTLVAVSHDPGDAEALQAEVIRLS